MPAARFLAVDAVSALFTLLLWMGLGYAGGNGVQALRKGLTGIGHLAVVPVTALIVGGMMFVYLKNRRKRIGEDNLPHPPEGL